MTNIPKELQSKIEREAKEHSRDLDNPYKYLAEINYEAGAAKYAEQLIKAVEALKKSIEFGEYAEWAIEESKELQKLDEDARKFLEEHERWLNE